MTQQIMVVSPDELRPGDEIVGRQTHGAIDKMWPGEVGVGEHPIVGGECIQLRSRATDPPWYDLNLCSDDSLSRIRRSHLIITART